VAVHLAIMLPGAGYGTLGPALRLPRLAAEEAGAEVVEVEYPAPPAPDGQVRQQEFQDAVSSQVSSFLTGSAPDRVTFIAKSLGTVVLAGLPPSVPLPPLVRAIWLTPLFGREDVRTGAIGKGWPSLLVAGGADNYHKPEHHGYVAKALGASSLVLSRANHCLEVPGDVRATLEGFRSLTEAVLSFVH
jgi:anti-sigma factor RsiW